MKFPLKRTLYHHLHVTFRTFSGPLRHSIYPLQKGRIGKYTVAIFNSADHCTCLDYRSLPQHVDRHEARRTLGNTMSIEFRAMTK